MVPIFLLYRLTLLIANTAGMPMENVSGTKTSVHTGSFADDYRLMTMRDHESMPKYAATGSSISILANRISWFYNLHGPSVQIDTACSSSLVALDMACQALRTGESDMVSPFFHLAVSMKALYKKAHRVI
jgi:acyl transferase domain-containing protein